MLKNPARGADFTTMLVSHLRGARGFTGTMGMILILVTSRMQFDRNQPPGAVGASLDVATHQIATALLALAATLLVIGVLRLRTTRTR